MVIQHPYTQLICNMIDRVEQGHYYVYMVLAAYKLDTLLTCTLIWGITTTGRYVENTNKKVVFFILPLKLITIILLFQLLFYYFPQEAHFIPQISSYSWSGSHISMIYSSSRICAFIPGIQKYLRSLQFHRALVVARSLVAWLSRNSCSLSFQITMIYL